MKKVIGWIELVLGLILIITPIVVMVIIMQVSSEFVINPDPIIPQEIAEPINNVSKAIPTIIEFLSAAYLVIIFLIGVLMFLEGLAKIKN